MFNKNQYFTSFLFLLEFVLSMDKKQNEELSFRCMTTNVLEYAKGLGGSKEYARLIENNHVIDVGLIIDISFLDDLSYQQLIQNRGYTVKLLKVELQGPRTVNNPDKLLLSTKEVISEFKKIFFITQKNHDPFIKYELIVSAPTSIFYPRNINTKEQHIQDDSKDLEQDCDHKESKPQPSFLKRLFLDLFFDIADIKTHQTDESTDSHHGSKEAYLGKVNSDIGLVYDMKTNTISLTQVRELSPNSINIKCLKNLPKKRSRYTFSDFISQEVIDEQAVHVELIASFLENWFIRRLNTFGGDVGKMPIKLKLDEINEPKIKLITCMNEFDKFIDKTIRKKFRDIAYLRHEYFWVLSGWCKVINPMNIGRNHFAVANKYNTNLKDFSEVKDIEDGILPELESYNNKNEEEDESKKTNRIIFEHELQFVKNCLNEAFFLIDNIVELESEDGQRKDYAKVHKKLEPFAKYVKYVLDYSNSILVYLLFDDYVKYYLFGEGNKIESEDYANWINDIVRLKNQMLKDKQELDRPNVFRYILNVLRNYSWVRNLDILLKEIDKEHLTRVQEDMKQMEKNLKYGQNKDIDYYNGLLKNKIADQFSVEIKIEE